MISSRILKVEMREKGGLFGFLKCKNFIFLKNVQQHLIIYCDLCTNILQS